METPDFTNHGEEIFVVHITYKALFRGLHIGHVNPAYTSQKCSRCGHVCEENRCGCLFKCLKCGFAIHSDLNASRNIKQVYLNTKCYSDRGVIVNHPVGPGPLSGFSEQATEFIHGVVDGNTLFIQFQFSIHYTL